VEELTDCVVHGLIDCRLHVTSLFADVIHLGHFPGRKVRQAQLNKFALLMQLVDSAERLLKGCGVVRGMEVENVHCVRVQLFQRGREELPQLLWLVRTRLSGIDLRGEREAAVFPLRIPGPSLLLSTNIKSRRVDLIVTL
jgi:hypothetical protein